MELYIICILKNACCIVCKSEDFKIFVQDVCFFLRWVWWSNDAAYDGVSLSISNLFTHFIQFILKYHLTWYTERHGLFVVLFQLNLSFPHFAYSFNFPESFIKREYLLILQKIAFLNVLTNWCLLWI